MANVSDEITKTKAQIEWILKTYPAARNSDGYLVLQWLKTFKGWPISWVEWPLVEDASVDSAIRLRQLIQNTEHRYEPTDPSIKAKRMARSKEYRKAIIQA